MADSNDKSGPDKGERVFVPQKPPVVPQANPAQPQGQPGTTPQPAAQPAKEGTGGPNAASQGGVFHFLGKESMAPQKPPVSTAVRQPDAVASPASKDTPDTKADTTEKPEQP